MMLINIQELDHVADKYNYKGNPFTGVMYRIDGEKVEILNEVRDGDIVGLHQCKYFPNEILLPHVHIDYVDFPGEYLDFPALYEDEKFTGVAYEFPDDQSVCLAKYLFINGTPVGSMAWYPSGEIKSLELERQSISQLFVWFIDGSLEALNLHSVERHKRLININFNQPKKLESLWIEADYFEWIKQHNADIKFHYFETENCFNLLTVNPHLSLIDRGISDSVLNSIATNDGLNGLSKITLSRTSLSEDAIVELTKVVTVSEIELRDSERDLSSIAQRIKLERPDCLVKLNNKEIER